MPTATALLKEVPLFKLLDADEREVLAAQLDELNFAKGDRVFAAGDPGGAIFVVNQGSVELSLELSTGEIISLERVGPGDFFGEMSLLDGDPRSADAIALEDTRVLRVDRHDLSLLFKQHPDAALDLLTVMGRRLRDADQILRTRPSSSPNQEVVEQTTMAQRIADALANFSGSIPVRFAACRLVRDLDRTQHRSYTQRHRVRPIPVRIPDDGCLPGGHLPLLFVFPSQNRQAAKDRIRSDVEYAANIRAGLEVTQLHVKLDRVQEQMLARFATLDREHAHPPRVLTGN